jgi:hypothetical protein
MMTTAQYITNIHSRYIHGNATEHTFRGDLQQLIENVCDIIQGVSIIIFVKKKK